MKEKEYCEKVDMQRNAWKTDKRGTSCANCGSKENLHFHHTDYKKNIGKTLCRECHVAEHNRLRQEKPPQQERVVCSKCNQDFYGITELQAKAYLKSHRCGDICKRCFKNRVHYAKGYCKPCYTTERLKSRRN